MRRLAIIVIVIAGTLIPAADASPPAPVPGPWSASPAVGNAVGHSLGFMMRVSRSRRITEVNMDYEGDVVLCTFRDVQSGNWLLGEHLRNLRRPIDPRKRTFSVSMSGTALNQADLPGATVHYSLRITGRFISKHAARGKIQFFEGCTVPARFAPWMAIG